MGNHNAENRAQNFSYVQGHFSLWCIVCFMNTLNNRPPTNGSETNGSADTNALWCYLIFVTDLLDIARQWCFRSRESLKRKGLRDVAFSNVRIWITLSWWYCRITSFDIVSSHLKEYSHYLLASVISDVAVDMHTA